MIESRNQIAMIGLLVLFCAGCADNLDLRPAPLYGVIVRVVDGDTYDVRRRDSGKVERLRLIGIDTPEVYPSQKLNQVAEAEGLRKEVIQQLGRLASDHARSLVLNREVVLLFDAANIKNNHRDRYERLLVYVYILGDDGHLQYCVNERMISDGFAHALTRYPFDALRQEHYRQLERLAREGGYGLWSSGAM